jgi:hypothetical protein
MAYDPGHNRNRAESGRDFERTWRARIYESFKTWKTVTIRFGNGVRVTQQNLDKTARGPDLFIDVEAKNKKAAKTIQTKVVAKIKSVKPSP